jgi:hypothetical protein
LNQQAEQTSLDWRHEWIEVQVTQIWQYYWLNQLKEMTSLAEKVRPVLEQYGTPAQRAEFFTGLTLMAYRRHRYVISDEIVSDSRAALSASLESQNLVSITMSRFLLGFTCLWNNDLIEGEEQLQAALGLAERTGNVVLQSRCLTYLTILYRKKGALQQVRRLIPKCLSVAEAGQMTEYIATAKANTAW